jgi:hypothetical protein
VQVSLETSGGFAGLRWSSSLDTAELPADQEAEAVRTLRELAASPPPVPEGGTVLPRYRLTADARVIELTESQIPSALRPLITELLRRAREGGS